MGFDRFSQVSVFLLTHTEIRDRIVKRVGHFLKCHRYRSFTKSI
ncbi:hypothetical protein CKA32_004899 [Geitlerinema sp. FC II]|nr:hypothetical protein CKA32_004899 [Geitlerinema sp. FC II]